MALFSVLDGYYGNCSYCLGYGRLYKKVERKRAPILFWLKVNEVSYFCDECDSKVNKKESKVRKVKENEVLGVDPRALSKEKIVSDTSLPLISRRALRRVKDRLLPPSKCDCCGSLAVSIKDNSVIYGKSYGDWPYVYHCGDCGAYVGLHRATDIPLGTMADAETRLARKQKHAFHRAIDAHFHGDKNAAYKWLAKKMKIPKKLCHYGFFTVAQCNEADKHIKKLMKG